MQITLWRILAVSLMGVCLLAASVRADSVTIATSRAGFNDTALWPGTCQQGLSSVTSTSTNGISVTATDATGGIDTETQATSYPSTAACAYGGWFGNFAPGDNLLYTGAISDTGSGPITLTFSTPVSGVGTQFQADAPIGEASDYTAEISAYDGATLLGTFTEACVVTTMGAADNSACFLGLTDSTGPDITSVVLSLTATSGYGLGDFAINDVSLLEGVSVPEPGTLVLLGTGLLGVVGAKRWKRLA